MASISSISNSGNAWAAQAAERKAKLFAKTDTDGSGGVDSTELQTLMDKVSERTGVTNTRTAADLVTELDTDRNGSLDADELKSGISSIVPLPSTVEFSQTRGAGGPPPGGAPPAEAASSSDSTTYDPLDTNQDGIVSAAEAAAGAANGTASTTDTLQALLKAIDTDKDGKLSTTEADTFAQQVSTAVETLQKASSTSANGSDRIDINQLAQQVLKQYAEIAAGQSQPATGSTINVSA
ncbi:EF-hand domain-containing protein [Rhodoferax sp. WC2427]|uniref:EF-hand domain-containing protein n=1 Tax=Rhodoferax sp. WC2427 TaxID=3234144 RepID=UPI003466D1A8